MSDVTLTRTIVVSNPTGLHVRPASLVMKLASQFQSKIELVKENTRVNGKSMMEILMLNAPQGTTLTLEATGADAEAALDALTNLFASQFAEMNTEENK